MIKSLLSSSLIAACLTVSSVAVADNHCAHDVKKLIEHDEGPYHFLYDNLIANQNIPNLTNLVYTLLVNPNQTNYDILLQYVYEIVNVVNGSNVLTFSEPDTGNATPVISPRIVVTESDGTVIIDTGAWTGTGPYARVSTFANWQSKSINENHNTRIAILDAQLWPCGRGVETKYSSSVSVFQDYVAVRLGEYLNNQGTVRLSRNVD